MDPLLAVSPVVLIFLLMTWGRRTADVAGAIGWIYTVLLAALWFRTSWEVLLLASLAGILASFPISLMVATSIFQVTVMEEAGAMRRVVVRPLGALTRVARRIGEGDFEARAPAAAGDEIGTLGAALNDMTGRLAQAYRDVEAKNTELATTLQDLRESRQRLALLEQLTGELSKFVPDGVKRLLERDPSATEMEKRSDEVSVLFLDVVGWPKWPGTWASTRARSARH